MTKTMPACLAFLSGLGFASMGWASTVLFESAPSTAGPQTSAQDYRAVVEQALAAPQRHAAQVPAYDTLSHHGVFGEPRLDLALRFTVTFDVTATQAGPWSFRAGVDFGHGGAVFLDGAPVAFKPGDLWWFGDYSASHSVFSLESLTLAEGRHVLQVLGLENCCDGGQSAQFRIADGPFVTFGRFDGLSPAMAIPEPATWALMACGCLAVAGWARRVRPAMTWPA